MKINWEKFWFEQDMWFDRQGGPSWEKQKAHIQSRVNALLKHKGRQRIRGK